MPRNNNIILIVGFILLVSLSLFLSGCGGSNKQMCFCHNKSNGFNHWVFIKNPNYKGGGNSLDYFLFKGSANDCHKACNNLTNLPEDKVSNENPYLGVEYKLVPVTDDELNKFAVAAGFASIAQDIASGNPVNTNKAAEQMYSNLKESYDKSNSEFLALLNTPKFAFLTHDYYYCSAGTLCSPTSQYGIGSVSDFISDISGNSVKPDLFDPHSYSCLSATDDDYEVTVAVNDKFCWVTGDGSSSNYYPTCGNLPDKASKKNLPPYGCLCSKDMTFNKDNIVTRFNNKCCKDGEVVDCS